MCLWHIRAIDWVDILRTEISRNYNWPVDTNIVDTLRGQKHTNTQLLILADRDRERV